MWTSLAWNEHLRVSAGVADPRFQFSAIHSDTRVTNKASAKISHGTLSYVNTIYTSLSLSKSDNAGTHVLPHPLT